MVSLKASFILLAASLSVLSVPLEERAVSDIVADFTHIDSDIAAVKADLNNLASAGVAGLDILNTDTSQLISGVQQATSDVTSTGLLDEQDGQNLLVNTVEPAAEALIDLLGVFVSTKPTFVELSNEVPGLIQSTETGIEGFAQIVGSLTTALNANSPPDVVSEGAPVQSAVENAFATAIASFSD